MQAVSSVIRKFVVDNFLFGQENQPIADDDSFLEKGIVDSTGILELVLFLESEYKIKLAPEELVPENLDSISSVAKFVGKKLQVTS